MKYIVLNLIMSLFIVCMINILLYNNAEEDSVSAGQEITEDSNHKVDDNDTIKDNIGIKDPDALKDDVPKGDIQNTGFADKLRDIRVVLKSDKGTYYHDEVIVTAENGLRITATGSISEFLGKSTVSIRDFHLDNGESITIEPSGNNERITVNTIKRTNGNPAYEGRLIVTKYDKGYVVVNALPLENYLYYVVPSEMPSYYNREALKAQAVCARTYALRYIINPGLPEFNADVDDSVSYQVYNHIDKEINTVNAVDETKGKVLVYGNDLIEAYFYSTSCGTGTKESIWSPEAISKLPYLGYGRYNPLNTQIDYSEEEKFSSFISTDDPMDYDYGMLYYRWHINQTATGTEILKKLQKRYDEARHTIFSIINGEKKSERPDELGDIQDIKVIKRDSGGAIHALQIIGSKKTYELVTGNTIRYCLAFDNTKAIRFDGSVADSSYMLPSTFFTIKNISCTNNTISYSLLGGGLGHGVGMSQNAANKMAGNGMTYEEIVKLFYVGTNIFEVKYEDSKSY